MIQRCVAAVVLVCSAGVASAADPDAGQPLARLSKAQLERFEAGRAVFERLFTPEDGLGPTFNAEGCVACHAEPVSGGGGPIVETHVSRFTPPDDCDALFESGGPVLQQRATPVLARAGIDGEARPPEANGTGLRSTPPLFGLGLVDGIPEKRILSREDPDDRNGDGISGRANRFIDGRVGRFGRKAFVPALADFNAGAFPLEQGVTTPFQPVEETVNGRSLPDGADTVPEPEVSLEEVAAVNDFTRLLAPPPAMEFEGQERKQFNRGEKLFGRIGCADCHVPSMRTGNSPIGALDNQEVFLYSDLLLHDMGDAVDDLCLGDAQPTEFRTEMLMGLRFRGRFLHDGSAPTILDAIKAHGGEASRSLEAFIALDTEDRDALLKFLEGI